MHQDIDPDSKEVIRTAYVPRALANARQRGKALTQEQAFDGYFSILLLAKQTGVTHHSEIRLESLSYDQRRLMRKFAILSQATGGDGHEILIKLQRMEQGLRSKHRRPVQQQKPRLTTEAKWVEKNGH